MRYILILLCGVFTGCANTYPYGLVGLESSGAEMQARFEVGAKTGQWYLYGYHESDPRNGFDGDGWPGESENGFGVRRLFGGHDTWDYGKTP